MQNNTQTEVFKLCPNCSAKCKAVYQYCNECGAALQNISANEPNLSATQNPTSFTPAPTIPTAEVEANNDIAPSQAEAKDNTSNQANTQNFTAQPEPEQNNEPEKEPIMNRFFDGVSAEDMFNYTGKKPKLYAKLQKQQMTPMNKLFCLPLLILGILFGFFGMACWYIYHKLYKQAAIFFGLAFFFYAINIAGVYSVIDGLATALPELITSPNEPTDQEIAMFFQTIIKGFPIALNALSYIGNLAQFVLAIVMPFYAYNTYRLTAIERIKKARLLPYGVDISSVGGTAKGYLALAIGVGIIIIIIASTIIVMPLFETIFNLLAESPELFEEIPANSFDTYSDFIY